MQLCTARTAWSESDQAVWAVHRCNSQWLGSLWSNSVIKLVWVLFGKCTTLVVTKCWPMVIRLPHGDQWKAEKLGVFRRWPITRCLIKSDRARLFIEHSINFRINGEHWSQWAHDVGSTLKLGWNFVVTLFQRWFNVEYLTLKRWWYFNVVSTLNIDQSSTLQYSRFSYNESTLKEG